MNENIDSYVTYEGKDSEINWACKICKDLPRYAGMYLYQRECEKNKVQNEDEQHADFIQVSGADVRRMGQKELRDKLGYVPQKSVLFSGTIRSNIAYGCPDASQEQVEQAAVIAQADSFIREKPDGYQAPIAQGGSNVSGGQKQRLSIARAIAKQPEILLFDDSFSALDFKTDVALRKALKEVTAETTTLIVAQRISTIIHADQILVLDEGRIVGQGTHRELLENCEVYRQIAMSQLSEEELAG